MSNNEDGDQSGLRIHDFDADTISRLNQARRNVLKVAVNVPGAGTHLWEINQSKKLRENLADFCQRWDVKGNVEDFAFQHFDTKLYITETTREQVKNGDLLCLATAPKTLLASVMKQLREPSAPEGRLKGLKQLAQSSPDPTFAKEFLGNHGMQWVISMIEANECKDHSLDFLLAAFLKLMDHGFVEWDSVLTKEFLKTVCGYVNKPPSDFDKILQHSLGIMECAVVNSQFFFEIESNLNLSTVISHLQKSNSDVQQFTLALLNSLFMKAPAKQPKISQIMGQKQFRTVVLNNVIRTPKNIESEMAHQLHVLQVLMFNTMEDRMMKTMEASASSERDKLIEMRNIAFDSAQHQQGNPSSKKASPVDFKKLGFVNYNNPAMDFDQTPPGLLCLDAMVYFARNQQDYYIRLILENSSRDDKHVCPFGKASIELTKKLCEILRIGEQPTELGEDFYPMFFTHDHAFEEFYCICIQLFNKTWKEMAAIKDDFDKVLSVVQDQIVLTLKGRPPSLDAFKQKLAALPYSEISKIREQEWEKEETFASKAAPVVELQREITPEIVDLIKEQRLTYLRDGSYFHGLQKKKVRCFCRLSPNLKVLHYGDVSDDSERSKSIDHLSNELAIAEVKELVVGKECPHVKNARSHKATTEMAFSLYYESNKSLDFIAHSKDSFCTWVDGINVLLGKKMTSPKAKSDLEILLTMEMKLRLLDIENIPIPDQPPPIPPLPKHYNFASPVC